MADRRVARLAPKSQCGVADEAIKDRCICRYRVRNMDLLLCNLCASIRVGLPRASRPQRQLYRALTHLGNGTTSTPRRGFSCARTGSRLCAATLLARARISFGNAATED